MPVGGFGDSKSKRKHYKKHVEGKGGGRGWVADMPGKYADADAYERAGIAFMEQPCSWPPLVQLTDTSSGDIHRWNHETGEFGVIEPSGTGFRLKTFHMRAPEPFLQAVARIHPDVFPRIIQFERASSLVRETAAREVEMGGMGDE